MKPEGTAVVTGASRGIGRATALELAARGFHVVATVRDLAAGERLVTEARDRGGSLEVLRLDVTDPGEFRFPDETRALVNNAGVRQAYLPVEETPSSEWREVFEANFFGLVELTRRAIPVLRDGGGGVICNVTTSSLFNALPFFGTYRASKAAVSALGEVLRLELAPFGIRVIEIMPGPIDTDLLRSSIAYRAPDAISYPLYRPVAERMGGRRAGGLPVTPPEDAARLIADAILEDEGPLRYGCDPLSIATLEAWRRADPEASLEQTLHGLVLDAGAGQ